MSNSYIEYWRESVGCSVDELGIVLTESQLNQMANDMRESQELMGMAFGYDQINCQDRSEIELLKEELEREKSKTVCEKCNGMGSYSIGGISHYSTHQCNCCNGEGRK